ncbi:leucine-rich repeat-containing protein 75A isoform X1 [Lepisosteus oculatus]|uniref:leucine-rich repeat-containing protein 75A isoform X1 n=1 Tax=Lepisosteus oculatus TaxID=7918 RepID=UPI003722F432
MGTKQTKGGGPESGESPQHGPASWKRTPTKERGDIFASLVLKPGERFGKGATPPPYLRRVGMIQEMMAMAQQGKQDEATELLKNLRQDLGMESTSLDDVLYRYASFRNLVDPITHELIISLARYVHCPKTVGPHPHTSLEGASSRPPRPHEGDALGAMEKVCRQLTYHLSPHSQWRRQGLMKRKPQACLKAILSSSPINNTVDLSGIPLTVKDMERLASFLQQNSDRVTSVELCFTELTDEAFLQLLPTLGMLPLLNTLSLNGNRLTKAVLRDLTDTLKDPEKFPSVTWIDLGNNVDIFSLPQPFLVSLRKRCPKQGNLPTILEFGESQMSDMESHDGNLSECLDDLGSEAEDSRQSPSPTSTPSQSQLVSKSEKPMGGETGDQVVMLAANQT